MSIGIIAKFMKNGEAVGSPIGEYYAPKMFKFFRSFAKKSKISSTESRIVNFEGADYYVTFVIGE